MSTMLIFRPHEREPKIVDLVARPWMADVDFVLGGPSEESARVLLGPTRQSGPSLCRLRFARSRGPVPQRRGDNRVGRGAATLHGRGADPPRRRTGRPPSWSRGGRRRRLTRRVGRDGGDPSCASTGLKAAVPPPFLILEDYCLVIFYCRIERIGPLVRRKINRLLTI